VGEGHITRRGDMSDINDDLHAVLTKLKEHLEKEFGFPENATNQDKLEIMIHKFGVPTKEVQDLMIRSGQHTQADIDKAIAQASISKKTLQ
jgi:hypothetical protein